MDKFTLIIDLFFLICSIIYLILGSIGYGNYNYNPLSINEYKQNWNLGPIMNIINTPIDQDCPTNYSSIFTNFFPGNLDGCDCRNTNRPLEKKLFYNKECSLIKMADKCKSIKKEEKLLLNIWKGKKLCVKRFEKNFWELDNNENEVEIMNSNEKLIKRKGMKVEKQSFLQLRNLNFNTKKNSINFNLSLNNSNRLKSNSKQNEKGNKKCNNPNHKICGYLDKNKSLLCLNKDLECPINDLIITEKSLFEKRSDKNLYKSILLNEKEAIYYTNQNPNGNIIIEILILPFQKCIIPDEGLLGRNQYPLSASKGEMQCLNKIENINNDINYKILDQYSQENFYNENLINERIKKLKGYMEKDEKTGKYLYYQKAEDNTMKIYYSNYISWNKTCANPKINSINKNELLENYTISKDDVIFWKNKLHIFCLIAGFNMILQFFFYFIVKILIYKNKIKFFASASFDLYLFLVNIFILIYIIILYNYTNNLIEPSYFFAKNKCGDDFTNKVLNFLFNDIMKIFSKLISIIFFAAFQILFIIIYYGINSKKFFNTSYNHELQINRGL
jgi:hypothetical protein